jgi:hypothetical protein
VNEDFFRSVFDFESHVFGVFHWGVEVEIADVVACIACIATLFAFGKDTVP